MIYLDSNATSKPSPAVCEAVMRGMTELWHNPSSLHRPGQRVRAEVELSRKAVAELLRADAKEIVFTASGTESIDLAIRGTLLARGGRGTIIRTDIEHPAVRKVAQDLADWQDAEVAAAPINARGVVEVDALAPMLDESVALVSVQWANNETGAIQPVERIAALCREKGVPFHCDATQWVGKAPTDVRALGCDLLTCAPHKFHGPKGVGILYIRAGHAIRPVVRGSQERGMRGGTENVPAILGAGVAARESIEWLADPSRRAKLSDLRDLFERWVLDLVPGSQVNGPTAPTERLWNTTNIAFPRLESEALLFLCSENGVCASAGSACSSGAMEPSGVLMAMGLSVDRAESSVRFSLCRETTRQDLEKAIAHLARCASMLRGVPVEPTLPAR